MTSAEDHAKPDLATQAVRAVIDNLGPDIAKHARLTDDFALDQGRVFRVDFDDLDGNTLYNYAYFDGRRHRVFPRSRDLIQFIARTSQPRNIVIRILQVAGIPGLIALVITLTICYLAVWGKGNIPEILGHALTAILGFYFATSVYESSKDRKA